MQRLVSVGGAFSVLLAFFLTTGLERWHDYCVERKKYRKTQLAKFVKKMKQAKAQVLAVCRVCEGAVFLAHLSL